MFKVDSRGVAVTFLVKLLRRLKYDKVGLVLPDGERYFRVLSVERPDGKFENLIKCWTDDESKAPWIALSVLR